ncbi:MAG: hypothetical protein ISS48_03595 [Candidatus Aenigmarchaeota archaeon]|nr:hypothetical protein [Candidatus Aenigmarchaeota archaeon]
MQLEELESKKREIIENLSIIEKGYKSGFITEEEFDEIRANIKKKIEEIDRRMHYIVNKQDKSIKPTHTAIKETIEPTMHQEILGKLDNLNNELKSIKNVADGSEIKTQFYSEAVQRTSNIELRIRNLELELEKMKEKKGSLLNMASKIENLKNSVDFTLSKLITAVELNDKFYQAINILPLIIDKNDIKNELNYLQNNIERLKLIGFWDERKRNFLLKFMTYLVQIWKGSNSPTISDIYINWIEKMDLFDYQKTRHALLRPVTDLKK